MILTYLQLLLIDILLWVACIAIMLHMGGLTGRHPAILYLFYHGYTYTFRLFQFTRGAPALFENWKSGFEPISRAEIQRAYLSGLAMLLVVTFVCVVLHQRHLRRCRRGGYTPNCRPFRRHLMWTVLYVTIPIGLVAMVVFRGPVLSGGSEVSLGTWTTSGYLGAITQWFSISVLILVFYYGFRPRLMLIVVLNLFVILLTTDARMEFVLPAIFLGFTYLQRTNRKWPSLRLLLGMMVVAVLFLATRELGPLLRTGKFSHARELIVDKFTELGAGDHADEAFLDMAAAAMTQIDERGEFFYGGTFAGLVVLPIPRQFWQGKPGQREWRAELADDSRPTTRCGMSVTVIGEAYANFGYPGMVLYGILLGTLFNRMNIWMTRAPYLSLVNLWSLSICAIEIQFLRDGLTAFIAYQVFLMQPVIMIIALHLLTVSRPSPVPPNLDPQKKE